MKYKVTISRKEYRDHTFEVSASSPEEAEGTALEQANDYDFRNSPIVHADVDVVEVVKERPVVKAVLNQGGEMTTGNSHFGEPAPRSWIDFEIVSKGKYTLNGVKCHLCTFRVSETSQLIFCLVDSNTI